MRILAGLGVLLVLGLIRRGKAAIGGRSRRT
jgi:hypothetical protein